ncbi:MAG: hypothetical protein EOP88_24235, partial [Verrucomicrobiaceae bacterium]
MNLNFLKLWPKGKGPALTITTKRAMNLRVDGELQHTEAGTTLDIDEAELGNLDASDYTIVSTNRPAIEVENPTPARPE